MHKIVIFDMQARLARPATLTAERVTRHRTLLRRSADGQSPSTGLLEGDQIVGE
jgi:hypothetical protein